ncbi:MAG: triose-phosphate isomerase, partial [Gemmatimonadetes bacterium]|nr:triose-phosphate isomerase [Gemmatimonadota bacterium]
PRRSDRTVIFFPSARAFSAVADACRERTDILLGVQNIHWEDKGAFTGESSAAMARDAGARMVLVGHSERRHVFGETDAMQARKCAAAVRAGLTPVLCVGELLPQREAGKAEAVVLEQLRLGLAEVEPATVERMLIAYEPVWAIGTGKTATPADASTMHAVIRSHLRELLGEKSKAVPILYGGSVNRTNAATLLAAGDVDGLLVGGASLEAETWSSIVSS